MIMPRSLGLAALVLSLISPAALAVDSPLGLPPVPIPTDNPQTPEKIALGERLFNDTRFSSTGEVSCATCHEREKAFTDRPLKVAEGVDGLKGTRNSPTVLNAAYFDSMFWDGREPDLEGQAAQPFVNPVEMALPSHDPILEIVRTDPGYVQAFREVFGKSGEEITMTEVTQAIAAFERTLVTGNTPFDRWRYGGEEDAMTEQQIRGFDVFINQGRCVSCHVVEETQATFTDSRFHNVGVGINAIEGEVDQLAPAFLKAKAEGVDVDKAVLSDKRTSELGRFAVGNEVDTIGAFRTPTLRNVAVTAPYMHDGSMETLRDVMVHYNNGGFTEPRKTPNHFLSGGIRPLDLTDKQIDDLVAFMEALTSPEFEQAETAAATKEK